MRLCKKISDKKRTAPLKQESYKSLTNSIKKENSSPKIGEVPRRGEGVSVTEGDKKVEN